MKKIILGWLTHQVISIVGFFSLCVVVGIFYGMYCVSAGVKPQEASALEEIPIFQLFCFIAMIASSLTGYWVSVKKVLELD